MSEELEKHNDGSWSGLVKTLIGTATTLVGGAGVWLSTQLFKGEDDAKDEVKTEQVAAQPAAAPVVVNVQQNQSNVQQQKTAAPQVIRERVVEKPAAAPAPAANTAAPAKKEYESW